MKILLTGATGFVGQPLVKHLVESGYDCWIISRSPKRAKINLPAGAPTLSYSDNWPTVDAVINLAGETIAGLWTMSKRRKVMMSRVTSTRRLVRWMAQVEPRPKMFISMSAVGIYGDRPGETLTESSPLDPQRKFRYLVCSAWEQEAMRAEGLGVRVVTLRLGNVLNPAGGYLGQLLQLYHYLPIVGFGNPKSMLSWVSLDDAVRLIQFALETPTLSGPLNVTAPNPVSQGEFTHALAQSRQRRRWGYIPNPLIRLGAGDFSQAFLDSQAILPSKALSYDFQFQQAFLSDLLI